MLYDRKLIKEVINKYDFELLEIEVKAEAYGEAANYLSENDCIEGMKLIYKAKQAMDEFAVALKQDLAEIDGVCSEISRLINKLHNEKEDIPIVITTNNHYIFVSNIGDIYSFIYSIGFDKYKKLYKYGIIKAEINKGKFNKKESKIGFSNKKNLEKYVDFKFYFYSLINNFNNCKSLDELDLLKENINNELGTLFYTDDLSIYLINNSKSIRNLTGISGIDIAQKLYENYDINRVRIKLNLKEYSSKDDKIIDLVRARLSCISLLNEIEKLDEVEDKDAIDMYTKIINNKNNEVEALMKELNINFTELELAINKVNT